MAAAAVLKNRKIANSTVASQAAQYRQPCVNGDWLCQWERAIFDPLQNRHPSTDHQKLSQVITSATSYHCAKLGAHPFTEDFWENG